MPAHRLAKSISRLEARSESIRGRIHHKFPNAKKILNKSSLVADNLRQHSSRLLAGAGLVGTILLTPLQTDSVSATKQKTDHSETLTHRQQLMLEIQDLIPHHPAKLTEQGAAVIDKIVSDYTGIPVKSYLEGQSLNHTLGFVGFEQHLRRYPGDTLSEHDDLQEAGMAPGNGAFGYFSKDASQFTTADYMREKYYCVVQTLYLDNWNQDYAKLKEWYKFRKMLILNPANGQAVVCAVGDAGPAEWTGKQFGASPEAMEALNLHIGPRKGLILMQFVDDPNNVIPLGPIKY